MQSPPEAAVAVVTLGCGRNDADSDQVGGAMQAAGYRLVEDPGDADCVLVNTCTFIAPAREESIEVILEACDLPERPSVAGGPPARPRVLVIGCMAERYGDELAAALPEVAGVLGFADYPRLPAIVGEVLRAGRLGTARQQGPALAGAGAAEGGHRRAAAGAGAEGGGHRRALPVLAMSAAAAAAADPTGAAPAGLTGAGPAHRPSHRPSAPTPPVAPPTAAFPVRTVPRGPWAYLKIAGGCDRACTFCTIPSYRGRFASRPLPELLAEARWLVAHGVRELVCVSENTTSWGKDTPAGRRGQAQLIAGFDAVEGLERVRLLYLQPAEILPELLDTMAASRTVAPYFDLSLQHASGPVLRRMGRSGDGERFLALVEGIRARDPEAVFRSSFITGFPGETEADVEELSAFLDAARLDWAGFFTYSAEDGTPSAAMPDQVPGDEARRRRDALLDVQEAVAADRAEAHVGRVLDVLVESVADAGCVGRSHREGPETDGEVRVHGPVRAAQVGDLLPCRVTAADGVDLLAQPVGGPR